MQSFSFVVGRFFFITSKPSCLRFCLEDSFDEQVEFEVVILVVLVQMIIITFAVVQVIYRFCSAYFVKKKNIYTCYKIELNEEKWRLEILHFPVCLKKIQWN